MSEPGANDANVNRSPLKRRKASAVVPLEQTALDALGIKYTGIAIDSRKVKPGDLFIAYGGESAVDSVLRPMAWPATAPTPAPIKAPDWA